ncbi:MAG: Gfo/Idh/MocA family protein, partial [Eubacterium aggregans]
TIPSLHYHTVYSRNPKTALAFKEKHGAKAIETDLLALAQNPEIDVVYIASPNSYHYEQALLMLSHGKHVLCEKTITTNAAKLARLITLAEE